MTEYTIKGTVERDLGGQLYITIPHKGAGDEFMLLEGTMFPQLKAGETLDVEIKITHFRP